MISNEDKKDVARHMGSKMAGKVAKVTNDSKSKALGKKTREPYFGLPSGEKDTPQLRNRFKNYVKKNKHTFGHLDKQRGYKLLRDNSFYEFNKPEHD